MKAKFAEFIFPDVWRIREEAESIIVPALPTLVPFSSGLVK